MSSEHSNSGWDYLFVSDLHVALGYDPVRRAYHAREDFFFDEAFFRWLRWADRTCAEGQRWELIFVGDTFDFFPVDCETVDRFFRARELRQQELDPAAPQQIAGYWEVYGDGRMWERIYQANEGDISDPNIIQPGQILTIPR